MGRVANKKSFFSLIISLVVSLVCFVTLGAGTAFLTTKTSNQSTKPQTNQTKTLTLNTNFAGEQYIVAGGQLYKYTASVEDIHQPLNSNDDSQNNTVYNASASLQTYSQSLDINNTQLFQLIFLKDSVSSLSSFAVYEANIASILTARMQPNKVGITLEYPHGTAYVSTSLDAEYTFGELALNTNTTLSYVNCEFSLGEKKGSTSLTAATSSTDAKIMRITSGTFNFSGSLTYTLASGKTGRAFYVSDGTLNLTGVTLNGFNHTGNGGAIYMENGNLNAANITIQNCQAANGGAIAADAGTVNISGGTYNANTATSNGGAVYVAGNATLNIAYGVGEGIVGKWLFNESITTAMVTITTQEELVNFLGNPPIIGLYYTYNAIEFSDIICYCLNGTFTVSGYPSNYNNVFFVQGAMADGSSTSYEYYVDGTAVMYNASGEVLASFSYDNEWLGDRVIEITQESDNEVLIRWLKANATKQSGGETDASNMVPPIFSNNSAGAGGALYYATTNASQISTGEYSNNSAASGGVVVSEATLTISGGTFTGNTATQLGGVVVVGGDGVTAVNITGGTFEQNSAAVGGVVAAYEADVTITGGTFEQNSAAVGGVVVVGGDGVTAVNITGGTFEQNSAAVGGVLATSQDATNATITITDGTYTGNFTTGDGLEFTYPELGTITISAGGVFAFLAQSTTPVTINGGTYTNNTAGGNGDLVVGGAIASVAPLNITGGTYSGNSEETYEGGGGAIYTAFDCSISGAEFVNNSADFGGAVFANVFGDETNIASINDCLFTENTARGGGAIAVYGTSFISNSTFTDNSAEGDGGAGSIRSYKSTITNCVFNQNTADVAGALQMWADEGYLIDCTMTNNTARYNGAISTDTCQLTISGGTYSGNTATTGYGGVVSVSGYSSLTITGGTFEENSASVGGVVAVTGGDTGSVTITDGTYTGNFTTGDGLEVSYPGFDTVTVNGGGVFAFLAQSTTPVTINGGTYTNNTAGGNGDLVVGGAIASVAPLNITGGTYEQNSAQDGAAILTFGELILNEATFTNNSGAFYSVVYCGGMATIDGCNFSNNILDRPNDAQGVLNFNGAGGIVSNSIFDGNTVGLCFKASVTLNNCTIINSIREGTSGEGNLIVNGGLFENNQDGAIILANQASLVVNGTTFKNNTAEYGSAIRALYKHNITLANTIFEGNVCTGEEKGNIYLGYSNGVGYSYITLGSELASAVSVYKEGITSFDDGDVASSYIAYSTNADYLASGLENITVTNLPDGASLSTEDKEHYLVVGLDDFGLFDISTGEQIYSWAKLVGDNNVDVSGTTLKMINKSLEGRLLVSDKIETIGTGVFVDSLIEELYLPDTVTTIEDDAFVSTSVLESKLTTLKIGGGIASVGRLVFETQLANLYFADLTAWCEADKNNDITLYINNLYINEQQVTDLVIPEGTTKIVGQAFRGLDVITSVSIPASVAQIDSRAFEATTNNTQFVVDSTSASFASNSGVLFDKNIQTLLAYPLAKGGSYSLPSTTLIIGSKAFYCANNISGITFNSGLTTIKDMAFAQLNLSQGSAIDITLPDSVVNIWPGAFTQSNLANVNLGTGLTSIELLVFAYSKLTSINLDNVTYVAYRAFYECKNLNGTLTFAPDVKIGQEAFVNCSNVLIYDFTNQTSVPQLGADAFDGLNSECKIYVPEALYSQWIVAENWIEYKDYIVANVEYGLFDSATGEMLYNWQQLLDNNMITVTDGEITAANASLAGKLIIADGVTSIGEAAFANCSGLTSITIPSSVTSIGHLAFWGCSGLISIIVDSSNTTYHSSGNCIIETATKTLIAGCKTSIIPTDGSVTGIGSGAFSGCIGLTSITIPDSVTSIGEAAFYYCTGLTSITVDVANTTYHSSGNCLIQTATKTLIAGCNTSTIPTDGSVTSIGNYAFSDCTGLTSITIPDSVTSIGSYAFSYCTGLTSVTIPDSVTSIGSNAFYYCSGLTSVTIPNSVTSIGTYAFYGCINVLEYDFTNSTSVPTLGTYAFTNINSDCKIYVPASLYNEWIVARNWSTWASYIEAVESVEELAAGLYDSTTGELMYSWQQLLDNNMITVTDGVLDGNDSTNTMAGKLIIADGVTSIGNQAFAGCSGLTEITIPNGVTSIGHLAFASCSGLISIIVDSSNTTYHSSGNCIIETATKTLIAGCKTSIIPTDGSVTGIGSGAFWGCSGLTSITIPDSVTSIGSSAFYNCSGLTSITIPNSVTSIGTYAFYGCSGLTSITIPDSVTIIGGYAFYNCSGLTSITIPTDGSVTIIGGYAFYGCSGLTSITIPDSVTSISSGAFSGCSGLTNVTIGNGVTSIDNYAFYGCTNVLEYDFTNSTSVPTLGTYAFTNINSDCKIYVPASLYDEWVVAENWSTWASYIESVEELAAGLYDSTTGELMYSWQQLLDNNMITVTDGVLDGNDNTNTMAGKLVISNTITSIGEDAFANCSGLTSITIPDTVTSIGGYAFFFCTGLTGELIIPNNVTSIGEGAFANCYGLTSVTIGNSVTSIGDYAFVDCTGLTSITIPDSVTSIAEGAFASCTNVLEYDFTNSTSVPTLGADVFDGVNSECKIYVPESLYDEWVAATNWSDWADYIAVYDQSSTVATSMVVQLIQLAPKASVMSTTETTSTGLFDSAGTQLYTWDELVANGMLTVADAVITDAAPTLASNLIISDTITAIGNYAFADCTSLTGVTIPASVTKIEYYAFYGCIGLESLVVDSSNATYKSETNCIIEIATNTLLVGCKNTTIPDSVNKIGVAAFYGCTGLTSISIPTSVTQIEYYAFYGCTGLSSITIPSSVTKIGKWAFQSCTGLTSVTLGSGLTSIGMGAFAYCSNVISYDFTDCTSIPTIGTYAFININADCQIQVPDGLYDDWIVSTNWQSWVANIFARGSKYGLFDSATGKQLYTWDELVDNGMVTVSSGAITDADTSMAGKLVISEDITAINSNAFYNCSRLTSVNIPDAVTSIGGYAFSRCTNLQTVVLPTALTTIEYDTFSYCTNLTTINIPTTVTIIGDFAFAYCDSLTEIKLPSGITSIGEYVFYHCSGLTTISIPSGVTSIGDSAFSFCESVENFIVDDANTIYSDDGNCVIEISSNTLLFGCKNTIIPNTITTIYHSAFIGCTKLTSITIPASVTSIYLSAFNYCYSLENIEVEDANTIYTDDGDCIIEIASNTLVVGCKTSVIPNTVTTIGEYAFGGCRGLTNIAIPNSVTSIGNSAFIYCSGLTEITIPDSVTSIESYAFRGCTSLTEIIIPNSVTSIGSCAFADCINVLEYDFTNYTSIPTLGSSAFVGINDDCKIWVPGDLLYTWMNEWSSYAEYIYSEDVEETNGGLYDLETDERIMRWHVLIAEEFIYVSEDGTTFEGFNPELIAYGSQVGLYKFVVAETITTIAAEAFAMCEFIAKLQIPASVQTIGDAAFMGCASLNLIEVDEGNLAYTSINGVLYSKDYTTLVAFPAGVAGEFEMPNTVTTISAGAFAYAIGLTSITMPSGITSIGDSAFALCTVVTLYDFRNSTAVPTLGTNAFQNINSKAIIYVPTNLYYSWRAAENWSNWGAYIYADGIEFEAGLYSSTTGDLLYSWDELISEQIITLDGTTITAANTELLQGKLVMSDDITAIGSQAFNACDGLTSVMLSSNLTSIGDFAFAMCAYIPSLDIPAGVTYIGYGAFVACASLAELVIDSSNTTYVNEDNVIFDINKTTLIAYAGAKTGSYTIPNTVTTIAPYAFAYAVSLTSLTIPNSVTTLSAYCLAMCSALSYLEVPASVTSIGDYAFAQSSNIREYSFKNHTVVPTIGENTFLGIYGLTLIYVPATLYDAWIVAEYWTELAPIIITERLEIDTSVPGMYDYLTGVFVSPWADLVSAGTVTLSGTTLSEMATIEPYEDEAGNQRGCYLVLPEGITAIGSQVGMQCTGLYGIYLPSTLRSIGAYSLTYTAIGEFNIPAACTSIGTYAFAMSLACTEINVESGNRSYSSESGVLFNKNKSTLIMFPAGKGGAYSIPSSVVTISALSFMYTIALTSVVIPSSVVSIGENAFYTSGISGRLVIPNGVTTIANSAFQNCSNLTVVAMGDNVTTIDQQAFYGCSSLTTINLPDSLTTLGASAFCGCKNLTGTINLSGVTVIPESAFDNASKITTVVLSSNLTSIGTFAFQGCSSLTGDLVIPDTCTLIGDCAFRYTAITSSVIGATTIGTNVFQYCTALESVSFTESVQSIGEFAFVDCSTLTGQLVIPNSCTSIGQAAFRGTGITSLVLGTGMTSISNYTFQDCASLTSVSFNGNVTNIGVSAFAGCTALTGQLVLPDSLVTIQNYAFQNCSSITSIKMGNNVTSVGDLAFYNCLGLSGTLTLSSKLQTIGQSAFRDCTRLTGTLNIPSTCTTIGNQAFQGCSGLTALSLGTGVTTIGDLAFYGCTNLAGSLTLPSTLTSIGQSAFRDNKKLTGILTIGNSVETIGNQAFQNCTGFTGLVIGTSVKYINELAFYNCTGLTSLQLNSTALVSIGTSALRGLTKITGTISFPNTLTTIGDFAFHSATGITKFTFGTSLSTLGAGAFANCTSVTIYDFTKATKVPTLSNPNCFNGITDGVQIIVPSSLYSSWIAATSWSDRAAYIVSASATSSASVSTLSLELGNIELNEEYTVVYVERKEDETEEPDVILNKKDYDMDNVPTINQTTSV